MQRALHGEQATTADQSTSKTAHCAQVLFVRTGILHGEADNMTVLLETSALLLEAHRASFSTAGAH